MTQAPTSQARLDFRIPFEGKSLIEQAAALNGMTTSEYMKSTLIEKSKQVIENSEARLLSDRDRDIFLSLLDAPASPNAALLAAAADFKKVVKEGSFIR